MINVGLVGTGFVAHQRARALVGNRRGQLLAVAGHDWDATQVFAATYGAIACPTWQDLLNHPALDLVMVCHINADHGAVAIAALEANQHVVVEYPLALNLAEAEQILTLARSKGLCLHVEHIELLGPAHQALQQHIGAIGQPIYGRYLTCKPKHPAPASWTYSPDLFGFPLVGALSRIHRLVHSFGPVERVYCQNHYDNLHPTESGWNYYSACVCTAQLTFTSGLLAEVTYAKGQIGWLEQRRFEVLGRQGQILLEGDQGRLITQAAAPCAIALGSRRGLLARDTENVLDHLTTGSPLYCQAEESLYSLRVANAAQRSATTGQAIGLPAV
ncbi:MAG: Gfo/Idh/MocA family protein [Nodosilinea sp.]